MIFFINLLFAVIGLFFSSIFFLFAMTGGPPYLIGGLLIVTHLLSFAFVWKTALKGKGSQFSFVMVLPAFVVTAVLWVFVLGRAAVSSFLPGSPVFVSECRMAGAQYYKLPSSVVHSIAYEWEESSPAYNHFELSSNHRVRSIISYNSSFPEVIEYIESGRRNGPYVRFSRNGSTRDIEALTADVLVSYQATPLNDAGDNSRGEGMVRYELTVTDRRNGDKLAYLRYVIYRKDVWRACGVTEGNTMDVHQFLLNALNLR